MKLIFIALFYSLVVCSLSLSANESDIKDVTDSGKPVVGYRRQFSTNSTDSDIEGKPILGKWRKWGRVLKNKLSMKPSANVYVHNANNNSLDSGVETGYKRIWVLNTSILGNNGTDGNATKTDEVSKEENKAIVNTTNKYLE